MHDQVDSAQPSMSHCEGVSGPPQDKKPTQANNPHQPVGLLQKNSNQLVPGDSQNNLHSQGISSTSSELDQEGTDTLQKPHLQPPLHPVSTTSDNPNSKKSFFGNTASSQVSAKTGGVFRRAASSAGRAAVVPLKFDEASDMEGLESVLEDLMTCCEENLKTIRADVSKYCQMSKGEGFYLVSWPVFCI